MDETELDFTKLCPPIKHLDLFDVLLAEHRLIDDAFNEWILTLEKDELPEGVWYLNGVHDMADRLVRLLEPKKEGETE